MDTSKKPRISILFPIFNDARFLRQSLDTVVNQTFKEWELIVMDGGSKDETLPILYEYAARHPNIFITSEPDEGGFHAVMKAEAKAKGDYVIILCSSDGLLDKEWFAKCIKVLDSDPEVSLLWGIPFDMSEEGKLLGPHYVFAHFLEGEKSFSRFSVIKRVLKKIDLRKPETIVEFFKKINPTKARMLGHMVKSAAVPQKQEWFNYWLKTGTIFPDGNTIVSRRAFSECFPKYVLGTREVGDFGIFNSNFNEAGYLAYCIPIPANFGRIHEGQIGQRAKEYNKMMSNIYLKRLEAFRHKLASGEMQMVFHDRAGAPIKQAGN